MTDLKEERNMLVQENEGRFKKIKKIIQKHKLKKLEEHKAFYDSKLKYIQEVELLQSEFQEIEKKISKLDQLLGLPSDIQAYIKEKIKEEEKKKEEKIKEEENKKEIDKEDHKGMMDLLGSN